MSFHRCSILNVPYGNRPRCTDQRLTWSNILMLSYKCFLCLVQDILMSMEWRREKITFLHQRNVNVSQLKNSLQMTLLENFAALVTQVFLHAWAGWAFSMWFGRFSFSTSAQKFILPSPPSVLVTNECECHKNFAQKISTWQNFKLSSPPSSSALVSASRPVSP